MVFNHRQQHSLSHSAALQFTDEMRVIFIDIKNVQFPPLLSENFLTLSTATNRCRANKIERKIPIFKNKFTFLLSILHDYVSMYLCVFVHRNSREKLLIMPASNQKLFQIVILSLKICNGVWGVPLKLFKLEWVADDDGDGVGVDGFSEIDARAKSTVIPLYYHHLLCTFLCMFKFTKNLLILTNWNGWQ